MTLLDAQQYDPQKDRKKKIRNVVIIVMVLFVFGFVWWNRFYPEERLVGHFFDALQKQDYKTAYAIWENDPGWENHLDRKAIHEYPFADFYRDWGPGSEWGLIKTQKVYGASKCPSMAGSSGTGVVVDVIVNDRVQHAQVWVEKSDHTLGYPPCDLIFR
ncbi:MAG TPA: hypothetical protein VMH04_11045 [Candidatus Solibacter sp.]|nr:hypothetical protein [Candidatus Solibacter sp.]